MSKIYTDREIEVKVNQLRSANQPVVRSAADMLHSLHKELHKAQEEYKAIKPIADTLLEQKSQLTLASLQYIAELSKAYRLAIKSSDSAGAGRLVGLIIIYLKTFNLYLNEHGEIDKDALSRIIEIPQVATNET